MNVLTHTHKGNAPAYKTLKLQLQTCEVTVLSPACATTEMLVGVIGGNMLPLYGLCLYLVMLQ